MGGRRSLWVSDWPVAGKHCEVTRMRTELGRGLGLAMVLGAARSFAGTPEHPTADIYPRAYVSKYVNFERHVAIAVDSRYLWH